MAIIAAVIVVAVVAPIGYYYATSAVHVTAINITSDDNVCGLTGHTFGGFTVGLSGRFHDTLIVPDGDTWSCTINYAATTTSGFAFSSASIPLTIPAGVLENLSVTITAPNFPYTGPLTIDVE